MVTISTVVKTSNLFCNPVYIYILGSKKHSSLKPTYNLVWFRCFSKLVCPETILVLHFREMNFAGFMDMIRIENPLAISASGYQRKRGELLIFAAELIAGRPKKISVLTSMDILLAPDKMFLQASRPKHTPRSRKRVFNYSQIVW